MEQLSNVRIEPRGPAEDSRRYLITASEGYLTADHLLTENTYRIVFYRVANGLQGQGFGKELLHLAKEHARSIGARAIVGSNITSSSSAGAIIAMFGEQSYNAPNAQVGIPLAETFIGATVYYPVTDADPTLRNDVQIGPHTESPLPSPIFQYWNNRDTSAE